MRGSLPLHSSSQWGIDSKDSAESRLKNCATGSEQPVTSSNPPGMDGVQRWVIDRNDNMNNSAARSDTPVVSSTTPGMDGSQISGPPPFLTKTYDMVDDSSTDPIVSWSMGNNSFVVWNPPEFARDLLPKYFKHNNFSSFVRQLNTYGFRKVDPDRWEFANEGFLRGKRHLLKNIHRRKTVSHHHSTQQQQQQQQTQSSTLGPCVEVGKFGLEGEIERLNRDKNVLMLELVRSRQQQQATENELQVLGHRLQVTEQRQQQMMSFLAKAIQNPSFLAQFVHQNENNKLLATDRKRRRLPKQEVEGDSGTTESDSQIVKYQPTTNDSARAMLMQFLNSSDLSSKMEVSNPLEALFTDLEPTSVDQAKEIDMSNRYSGVTLTEMQACIPDSSPVPIGEIPAEPSSRTLSSLPDDKATLEVHGLDENDHKSLIVGNANLRENTGDVRMSAKGLNCDDEGLIVREVDPRTRSNSAVVVPGTNDVFWEQFLTANPDSPDTESDDADTPESRVQEGVQEGDAESAQWWTGRPSMDRLAEQMGQLAPGRKL